MNVITIPPFSFSFSLSPLILPLLPFIFPWCGSPFQCSTAALTQTGRAAPCGASEASRQQEREEGPSARSGARRTEANWQDTTNKRARNGRERMHAGACWARQSVEAIQCRDASATLFLFFGCGGKAGTGAAGQGKKQGRVGSSKVERMHQSGVHQKNRWPRAWGPTKVTAVWAAQSHHASRQLWQEWGRGSEGSRSGRAAGAARQVLKKRRVPLSLLRSLGGLHPAHPARVAQGLRGQGGWRGDGSEWVAGRQWECRQRHHPHTHSRLLPAPRLLLTLWPNGPARHTGVLSA